MSPAGGAARAPRNWTELVTDVSNAFCLDLAAGGRRRPGSSAEPQPEFKRVAIEAGKLKRFAEKQGYGVADLAVALDYCIAHRIQLTSPAGVVLFVDLARKRAFALAKASGELARSRSNQTELTSWEAAIDYEAVRHREGDPRASYWLRRFQRAAGHTRGAVLVEWSRERGNDGS